MATIEAINEHFKREGMNVVVDQVIPVGEAELTMLLLADPLLQEMNGDFERVIWVNVVGQDENTSARLKKIIPIFPVSCNNYVCEWDSNKRWILRYAC